MNEQELRAILARNPQIVVHDPDCRTLPSPVTEPGTADALDGVASGEETSLGRPIVSLVFYRVRLLDPDGLNPKDLLDGLVKAGLLRDDNETAIDFRPPRQVKVEHRYDERTEITITYANTEFAQ